MAARYVEIGQHPDIRRELRGTLAEVLTAPSPNPGTFAMPEDVPGCFLEMGLDGLWTGASVGSFGSIEELNALPTAYLATGSTATVAGAQKQWNGTGWAVGGEASILAIISSAAQNPVALAVDLEKYSNPVSWTTGEVIRAPAMRANGGNLYIARSNGACGATPPTHTNTTNTTDGGVLWLYMGPAPAYYADTSHGPVVTDNTSTHASLTNIYLPGTTGAGRYTVRGGSEVVVSTTSIQPRVYQSKPGNTVPVSAGVTFEFYTDSTLFEVRGIGPFNVEVDGRLGGFGAYASATSHYLRFDFSASGPAKSRKVVVHGNKDVFTFESVNVLPSAQIWKKTDKSTVRVAWVSDSICAGSEPGPHCAGNTLPYRVGQDLGGLDVWNFSAAGTGYIAQNGADHYTFEGRLPQVLASNPVAIIVMGSINDVVPGPLAAAVTSFIASARFQGFSGPIFGIGVIPKNNAGVAARETEIATGFADSGDANAWFIPMYGDPTGPWITGAWNNSANPQSVNATRYIEANGTGTHPVDVGTAYLAGRCSQALINKIRSLLA